jgi:hypothetical protein
LKIDVEAIHVDVFDNLKKLLEEIRDLYFKLSEYPLFIKDVQGIGVNIEDYIKNLLEILEKNEAALFITCALSDFVDNSDTKNELIETVDNLSKIRTRILFIIGQLRGGMYLRKWSEKDVN